MGDTGEAVGKFLNITVDSLTPRSVRLLMLAAIGFLTYEMWAINERVNQHEETLSGLKQSIVEVQAYQKATLKSVEEGNADLQFIRRRLMSTPALLEVKP